jgi:hypothetical protein
MNKIKIVLMNVQIFNLISHKLLLSALGSSFVNIRLKLNTAKLNNILKI